MKALYCSLAFAALVLLSASAQSASCAVDTAVYFGNGVVTTKEDALRNARITGKAVVREAPSSEGCRFEFKVAYNQSSGLLLDVLEAARQTLGNEYPTLVMAFILQKAGLPNSLFAALLPAGTLQAFNDRFRSATVQSLVSGSTSTKTLNEHVSLYTNDLETKRVILLAHSQGNIYANLAASRLSSQSPSLYVRFAIIPVASPEYFCAKSLVGHVRFSDDLVIGAVAVARSLLGLPAPLSSNDEDGYDVDFWSHYYLEAYYIDVSSRHFIINGILTTARLLPTVTTPSIYRLTATGVIAGRDEEAGYPSLPFSAQVGDTISLYWDIDESLPPDRDNSTEIMWRGYGMPHGFATATQSQTYYPASSPSYSNSFQLVVYPSCSGCTGPFTYQLTAVHPVNSGYHAAQYLELTGGAGLSFNELRTQNPLPYSKWSVGNVFFSVCPVAGGHCPASVWVVVQSLSYRQL